MRGGSRSRRRGGEAWEGGGVEGVGEVERGRGVGGRERERDGGGGKEGGGEVRWKAWGRRGRRGDGGWEGEGGWRKGESVVVRQGGGYGGERRGEGVRGGVLCSGVGGTAM